MSAAFENTDLASMQEYMDKHFKVSQAGMNPTLGKILDWATEIVKQAIQNSDLKNVSKADVLKLVGNMYDTYILPIDLPGPDVVLDPLLKQLLLNQASKLYDKFYTQQLNPVPILDDANMDMSLPCVQPETEEVQPQ